jgi:DNA-binding NarL/FixJ family response regulator
VTGRRLRVLCVDDHAFLAEGLRSRLALEPDMELVGRLATAQGLIEEVQRAGIDVVLLDIEMPGPDPFEVLADLRRRCPGVRAIMLSAFVRDHYIDMALRNGAWGYLSKSDAPDTVVAAIRKSACGEFVFGLAVLDRCRRPAESDAGERPSSRLEQLTPREVQVLRMIARGMTRIQIARALHRSPKTVDNHRAALMEKLGIHTSVELARYALREGLAEA